VRRWALASAGVHLAALALLIPRLQSEPELETHVVTEVDLVDHPPGAQASVRPSPTPRVTPGKTRARRATRRRAPRPAPPPPPTQEQSSEENPSELLIMRPEPPEPPEPPETPPPDENRFASFFSKNRRPQPAPATRQALGSMEINRYADGGRTLRSTGGEPDHAAMGLLDLAAGKLGDRTGSQACDPYRGWRDPERRELVLLVDTSGSVVRSRRAPASLVCAAGAAMAAMKRGFAVTVINFSSITQRYGPTRDIAVVYRALSTFQAQGTVLPRPELLKLDGSNPRDFVLISDTAIHNLKQVIPDYGKVLRANPRNRALLYYLGGGQLEDMDPAEAVELIRRTGFKAEQVDRNWAGS